MTERPTIKIHIGDHVAVVVVTKATSGVDKPVTKTPVSRTAKSNLRSNLGSSHQLENFQCEHIMDIYYEIIDEIIENLFLRQFSEHEI